MAKDAPADKVATASRQVLDDPAYGAAARRIADTLAAERRTRPSAADRAEALLMG